MIHWDGADVKVFLDILQRVEQGETVEVSVRGETAKTVSTAKDARALLPLQNAQVELTRQEYEDVLRTFLPSKEMRKHLANRELSRWQILELILGAPVPLRIKAECCRALSARDDVLHHVLDRLDDPHLDLSARYEWELELDLSFAMHAQSIQTALDELSLNPGEIILLYEVWYDNDYLEDNESSAVPFLSADAALRYLRAEMREEEWNEETPCWTRLEKWVPGENDEMLCRYRYYLIRDEFAFFEKVEPRRRGYQGRLAGPFCYSGQSVDLNLPVPYRPGDIVEVNCLPFAPVKHVLLLEVGDDCCGVSCLYRTEDGKWETGALKHGHFMESYRPLISPLYRIAAHHADLPPEVQPLKAVQAYIGGDAEKGRQLWTAIHRLSHALRTNELMKLVGYEKGYDETEAMLTYRTDRRIAREDVGAILPCGEKE